MRPLEIKQPKHPHLSQHSPPLPGGTHTTPKPSPSGHRGGKGELGHEERGRALFYPRDGGSLAGARSDAKPGGVGRPFTPTKGWRVIWVERGEELTPEERAQPPAGRSLTPGGRALREQGEPDPEGKRPVPEGKSGEPVPEGRRGPVSSPGRRRTDGSTEREHKERCCPRPRRRERLPGGPDPSPSSAAHAAPRAATVTAAEGAWPRKPAPAPQPIERAGPAPSLRSLARPNADPRPVASQSE